MDELEKHYNTLQLQADVYEAMANAYLECTDNASALAALIKQIRVAKTNVQHTYNGTVCTQETFAKLYSKFAVAPGKCDGAIPAILV